MQLKLTGDARSNFTKASKQTRESAEPLLEVLESCFDVNWFREIAPHIWLALIKPHHDVAQHFGMTHEYFVIGNGHDADFHQRTLQQIPPDNIVDRIDVGLRFIATDAARAEAFCAAWAKKNKATVIVVKAKSKSPQTSHREAMYKTLSASLYRRDFFAEAEPVRDPSEFFGRESDVNELLAKIYSGAPVAVFGLRKIGKSSLLGRVQDLLRKESSYLVAQAMLIGNSTRLKSGRWWHAAQDAIGAWQADLKQQIERHGVQLHVKTDKLNDAIQRKHDNRALAVAFERDIHALLKAAHALAKRLERDDVRFVLILDECDHFYPHLNNAGHWRTDFFEFWNSLQGIKRSLDNPDELTYVLGGVNPSGVEQGALLDQANPLYETQKMYLGPMSRDDADELFRNLGARMGLIFNEPALAEAYSLVGGHPLLLRKLGTAVHELSINRSERTEIKQIHVERAYKTNRSDLFNQVVWFLEHLATVAPDEERLLRDVAVGGAAAYGTIWADNAFRETYAYHLQNYGLLKFTSDLPEITSALVLDAMKRPVATEFNEQKSQLKDMVESIEVGARARLRLDLEHGRLPEEAVERVVASIPSDARNRALSREDLLDLGQGAGLVAVLESLNWGDYEILLDKFHEDISWIGGAISREQRKSTIKGVFKDAHVIRHNNDHALKQMIDEQGYQAVYARFSSVREMLGA